MSRKNRSTGAHSLDSTIWSVTKNAKKAIALRDSVVERMPDNEIITTLFASELKTLHRGYTDVYIDMGYGEIAAQKMAASDLFMANFAELNSIFTDGPDVSVDLVFDSMAESRIFHLEQVCRNSELFVVTPAMHATIVAAAATLDKEDLRRLSGDDIVAPFGMILFPDIQPFYLTEDAGIPEELIAITWMYRPGETIVDGQPVRDDNLQVSVWIDCNGPAESEGFDYIREIAASNGTPLPDMMPVANGTLRLDFQDQEDEGSEIFDRLKQVHLPREDNVRPGEYSGEAIRGINVTEWTLQYLMAFMRLSKTKVISENRFSEGVPGIKHMKRKPYHDVRIVHLGGYSDDREDKEQRSGDSGRKYTRKWMVRMHKVNQWYPSQGVHKIIWRGPFIKGPEDAPLIEGEKVHVV